MIDFLLGMLLILLNVLSLFIVSECWWRDKFDKPIILWICGFLTGIGSVVILYWGIIK